MRGQKGLSVCLWNAIAAGSWRMLLLLLIAHSRAFVVVFDRVGESAAPSSKASRDSQSLALNFSVELTSDCLCPDG